MTNYNLALQFFLQISIILVFIRLVGIAARFLSQPQVVGEMIAGVLIGPSVFEAWYPETHSLLFPKQSVSVIYVLSQLGLVLYMFVIGMEFNVDLVRGRITRAISVSVAGIVAPFALAGLLSHYLYQGHSLFAPEVTQWQAILFMGSAMSITAFPMLARILYERGIAATSMGTTALAAASIDDAAAWCLLALVVASFSSDFSIAVYAIGGGLLYAFVIGFIIRPLLKRIHFWTGPHLSTPAFAGILALLMACSWYTDYVGIYAVFGAFALGLAIPRNAIITELRQRIEPLTTCLLLPLFFIYSGLNTRIDLVISSNLVGITALVVLVACVAKGAACAGAAKLFGETTRDALAIGALMNARGLMELILLNLGLERGLITSSLFSIMVVMAIVTTLLATPLFEMISWFGSKKDSPSIAVTRPT